MINLSNVSKYYGNFLALDNINFDIEEGRIVAFLGPNGAGKTTTMRILTGYMPPSKGDVKIDGMDIFEEPEKVKSIIGYLPENPPLYPELTVYEFLAFVAELRKVPKDKISYQVDKVIELADLSQRRNTLIRFLSKGLKQRVGIAQSIVNSPKVLVLDEPTVGLDPVQVLDVRKLIRRLSEEEKRTVILSTHILSEASEICKEAIIINNGKIIAMDSIDKLRSHQANELRILAKVARTSAPLSDALRKIPGVSSATVNDNGVEVYAASDVREQVAKAIVDSGAGLLEMSRADDSLEEVFIKLVG